jgi:hypothetical protein
MLFSYKLFSKNRDETIREYRKCYQKVNFTYHSVVVYLTQPYRGKNNKNVLDYSMENLKIERILREIEPMNSKKAQNIISLASPY